MFRATSFVESLAKLADFQFAWVLPAHGQRWQLPAERMRREISISFRGAGLS